MKRKKHYFDVAFLIAILLAVIGYIWITFPIYPDFQRPVSSYEGLQHELSNGNVQNIIFPSMEETNNTDSTYYLVLESRSRTSRAVGYGISWNEVIEHTKYQCTLSCQRDSYNYALVEDRNYRGIPIEIRSQETAGNMTVLLGDYIYSYSFYLEADPDPDYNLKYVEEGNQTLTGYIENLIDLFIETK